jgi:hypothetical protein
VGYPPFSLSNNNAEIRRLKGRVAELEREAARVAVADEAYLPGVRLEENKEDARLRLFFEGKPDSEVRALLKKNGFRWSPTNEAWQRLLNANARHTVTWMKPQLAALLGVELAEVTAVDVPDDVPEEDDTQEVWAGDDFAPVVWLEEVTAVVEAEGEAEEAEEAEETEEVTDVEEEQDPPVVKDVGRTSVERMLASGCYFMEEEGVHWWVKDGGGVRRLTKDEVIAMHLMCMEGVLGNQPPYQSYMLAKYAGWAMGERDVKQKLAEGQSIHTGKKGRWWIQAGRLVAPINDDVWQAVLRLVKLGEIEQTWEVPAQMTLF